MRAALRSRVLVLDLGRPSLGHPRSVRTGTHIALGNRELDGDIVHFDDDVVLAECCAAADADRVAEASLENLDAGWEGRCVVGDGHEASAEGEDEARVVAVAEVEADGRF